MDQAVAVQRLGDGCPAAMSRNADGEFTRAAMVRDRCTGRSFDSAKHGSSVKVETMRNHGGHSMGRPTSEFTHSEYTRLVDEEKYPDTPLVPLDEPFVNSSGRILNVLLKRFTSAAWIESNAGSLRANHYHKTDWHYSFVTSGTVVYGWRPSGSTALPEVSEFHAGQLFFTPPMVEHVMYFPVPTTFMTFARNLRDHVSHESDVVRVEPLFSVVWSETAGAFTYEVNGSGRRSSPAGGPLS